MSEPSPNHEQLSAYLDGELSDAERQRLERALAEDAQLAAELDELRQVRQMLRAFGVERAPEDFVDTVLARAARPRLVGEHSAHPAPRGGGWVRVLSVAAVVLIAVSLGAVVVGTLWKTWQITSAPGDRYAGGDTKESPDPLASRSPADQANPVRPPRLEQAAPQSLAPQGPHADGPSDASDSLGSTEDALRARGPAAANLAREKVAAAPSRGRLDAVQPQQEGAGTPPAETTPGVLSEVWGFAAVCPRPNPPQTQPASGPSTQPSTRPSSRPTTAETK